MNGQLKMRRKIWIAALAALVIVIAGGAFALRPQTNPTPATVAGGNDNEPNQLDLSGGVAVTSSTGWITTAPNQLDLPGGVAVTVAGGNGKGRGPNQLNFPGDIALDAKGNLYVIDSRNLRIQKWKPGATRGTAVAGGNGSRPNQLNWPEGIAVDGKGNLYITGVYSAGNTFYPIVQKWKPGATRSITVDISSGNRWGIGHMNIPQAIAVDGDGNLYIASDVFLDSGNLHIEKWKPGATRGITVAVSSGKRWRGFGHLQGIPVDIALDGDGNLYTSEARNPRVQKWRLP